MKTLKAYPDDFKSFGILRFEIGEIAGRGQPEQFALLNEDQCYLLLTYTRNTPKVRALKISLVKAFRQARDCASVTDEQYLPFYRAMHDEVAALAQRAKDLGSDAPERVFHINANQAINKAMGIASGQRGTLDMSQRLILTTLQAIYQRHLHNALEAGADHREGGRKAKEAVLAYVATAGVLLLEVAA
jgi:phage regulator Rha-like protein